MPRAKKSTEKELSVAEVRRAELALEAMRGGISSMLKTLRGQVYFGKGATVSVDKNTAELVITSKDGIYKITFA